MKKEGMKWEDLVRVGVQLPPGTGEADLWAQAPRDPLWTTHQTLRLCLK